MFLRNQLFAAGLGARLCHQTVGRFPRHTVQFHDRVIDTVLCGDYHMGVQPLVVSTVAMLRHMSPS